MIAVETIPSPIGVMTMATREGVVLAVEFEQAGEPPEWLRRRHRDQGFAAPAEPTGAARSLADYFTDPDTGFGELRLEMPGSNFELRVWAALRSIPVGETVSRGWIARAVGERGPPRRSATPTLAIRSRSSFPATG